MPRYFFDTHDGAELVQDTEGVILPDREAAREEAHATLGQMAKDTASDTRNLYVNVNDAGGAPIYTVCMAVIGRWLT